MSARSKQLALAYVTANGLTPLYTVPAGKVAILKGLAMFNNAGSAQNVMVVITDSGNDYYVYRVYFNANGTGGDAFWNTGWLVLSAGQKLQLWRSSGTTGIFVTVAGAELDA